MPTGPAEEGCCRMSTGKPHSDVFIREYASAANRSSRAGGDKILLKWEAQSEICG